MYKNPPSDSNLYHPPAAFPFSAFYPLPLAALHKTDAEWLGFVDVLFAAMSQAREIVIVRESFTRHRLLANGTLNDYLKRAVGLGLIEPYGTDTDGTMFRAPAAVLEPGGLIHKPRLYVERGWVHWRRGLAERQVINAFCLAWTRQAAAHRPAHEIDLSISQILHRCRELQGATPRATRDAVKSWLGDGVLGTHLVDDELRYVFAADQMARTAPQPDSPAAIRQAIRFQFGLAEEDPWLPILAFLRQNNVKIEEIRQIYQSVIGLHPELQHPTDAGELHPLLAELQNQAAKRRSHINWRRYIDDFLTARYNSRDMISAVATFVDFTFGARLADVQRAGWTPAKWTHLRTAVLVCELSPGHRPNEETPQPQLALYRDGKSKSGRQEQLFALNCGSGWQRTYHRIPLHEELRHLQPDEAVLLAAIMPAPDAYVKVKNAQLRLGVFIARPRPQPRRDVIEL